MEKIFKSLFKSSIFVLSSLSIAGIVVYLRKRLRMKNPLKNNVLDQMKDTPLILIKSLSDLTGCKIYGKCEYMLPFTSKDRMIKNILLNAIK